MALSLANLKRNLKLLVLFVLVLARKTNGSNCRFCDKNNHFGFAYNLDCVRNYEPRTDGRFECMKSCMVDCWQICKPAKTIREGGRPPTKDEIRSGALTLNRSGGFGSDACIVFLVFVFFGLLACVAGIVLLALNKRKQQSGYGTGMAMQGQYVQQQPAYGYRSDWNVMQLQQPILQQQLMQVQPLQYQIQQYPNQTPADKPLSSVAI